MRSSAVRLSRILYWVFMFGMVAVPLVELVLYLNLEWMLNHLGAVSVLPPGVEGALPLQAPVTALTKTLCLAVAAVPTVLTCLMLRHLALLFRGYAGGEIFTQESVRHIRMVGVLLLARELSAPLIGALMAIAITINNPPGQHMFTLGLDSSNLTQLVTALALIVGASVMDHGRKLREEALLTI